MSEVKFNVKEDGEFLILYVKGELNAQTVPEARKEIDRLIEEFDIPNVSGLKIIVDYSGVTDLDSASVGNTLERIELVMQYQHRIAFINVPEKFKHIIELHHLEDRVKICKNLAGAKNALSKKNQ